MKSRALDDADQVLNQALAYFDRLRRVNEEQKLVAASRRTSSGEIRCGRNRPAQAHGRKPKAARHASGLNEPIVVQHFWAACAASKGCTTNSGFAHVSISLYLQAFARLEWFDFRCDMEVALQGSGMSPGSLARSIAPRDPRRVRGRVAGLLL